MCLFTSDRDRRLWLWALIVLVAIFATLGTVGTLVEVLRERNLLRLSGALALLLMVGAAVGLWARRRPSRGEMGWLPALLLSICWRGSGCSIQRSAPT